MNVKLKYNIPGPSYAANLIMERGIDPNILLFPNEAHLASPFDLENMQQAVDAVLHHVGAPTLVVVDSDCDGNCAAAIFINYIREVFPQWKIDFVVHERKGHGLEDIAESIDLDEYALIVLPDAGSNDDIYFTSHEYTDFVILDHHLRTCPVFEHDNAVLVNNQWSSNYANKALSGAGVTWQFCRAMDKHLNLELANKYMDLAAVAIIGDVMNITTPENNYIISTGLKSITNHFLKLLVDNASFKLGNTLTPMGIAFYIVPLINSMCRMGTVDEKERMFLSFIDPHFQVECHKRGVAAGTKIDVATESVRECTNTKAKQSRTQTKMAELCEKQIIEDELLANKILTIVLDETFDDMPSEMNGLTATKLSNDYGHPTLIGRVNSDGMLRGSIRGLSTIDMPPLKVFLNDSGMFEYLEGHDNAAGFSIPYSKLEQFHAWANEQLKDVDLNTKMWMVDFDISANDTALVDIINQMSELKNYWGQGFPEALISVRNLSVNRSDITVMGKTADTVKIMHNGIAYMFFKKDIEEVKKITQYQNAIFNIVGTANLNIYYNKVTPQIFVTDYEIKDNSWGF